jgi:hypothetical protein
VPGASERLQDLWNLFPGSAPQKAQAALILKDKDNLTWFLSWEDPEVRLEWIKEKLGLGVCSYFSTLLFFPKF